MKMNISAGLAFESLSGRISCYVPYSFVPAGIAFAILQSILEKRVNTKTNEA